MGAIPLPFFIFQLFSILILYRGYNIVSNDEIMTIKELAEYLKIAEKTAYRFVSEGKIPGFKVGSARRFRKAEIDRWIEQQESGSQKQDGAVL